MSRGAGHIVFGTLQSTAATCALLSAIFSSLEAAQETGDNAFAYPSIALAVIGGAANGGGVWLVPYYPVKNEIVAFIDKATLASRLVLKAVFSDKLQAGIGSIKRFKIGERMTVADPRAAGAIADAIWVAPALFVTVWHFVELAQQPAGARRSIAIVNETTNVTDYIGRVAYAVAVTGQGPVKAGGVAVMAAASLCSFGLLFADAAIMPEAAA